MNLNGIESSRSLEATTEATRLKGRCDCETGEALRQLLHALSHDIRNPVIGMQMVLQNLLHATNDDTVPVPRAVLERMLEGGDRQLHLISALLDAHAESPEALHLNREPLSLAELVNVLTQQLEPCCTKNSATLRCQISPDLPRVDADPVQLRRVFEQLIANALKHNPPGIELEIDAKVDGETIRCWVKDNGVGIPTQECMQLFGRYQRGNQTRLTHGLGIGLYLCQQIIHAHGGEIHVLSHSNAGATVYFTLPIK